MRADRFAGWVPIRVFWERDAALVDWGYIGDKRFTEPFFSDTIELSLLNPANLLFRHHTPVETLAEWREVSPGLPPKGFIFHMSRCGSTLVAQMLAALPRTVVISEAGPIDSVIRANFRDPSIADDRQATWLQWMVSALGQPRTGEEKDLFIKFDAWHTMHLGLIERAFPHVPWIFLYRNPVEVLVSQAKRKSAHLIPGLIEPEFFGLDRDVAFRFQQEEYSATVLARVCEAALSHHKPGRSMLIDYNSLPGIVLESVLDFFQLACTKDDIERLSHAAQFNSKNPALHFQEDTAAKNRQASREVIEAADRWLAPVYEKLQAASLLY